MGFYTNPIFLLFTREREERRFLFLLTFLHISIRTCDACLEGLNEHMQRSELTKSRIFPQYVGWIFKMILTFPDFSRFGFNSSISQRHISVGVEAFIGSFQM